MDGNKSKDENTPTQTKIENNDIYNKSIEEIIKMYENVLKLKNEFEEKNAIKDKELKEAIKELKDAKKTIEIKDKELKEAKKKNEEFGDLNKIPKQIIDKINRSSTTKKGLRINELIKSIENLKKNFSEMDISNIEEIQDYLTGVKTYDKFEFNSIKRAFNYKFGDSINNKDFIDKMRNGLFSLFSDEQGTIDRVKRFFCDIKNDIKDFLYIPMLEDNTLCEFKKHLYLGAISSQTDSDDYNSIQEYIFYTKEYFNESDFKEIKVEISRDDNFIACFKEYQKEETVLLNLETIKKFMFSKTIKEAYLETCKEIFGENAPFVTIENIEKELNNIYETIIKKMKFSKFENGFYGVTIYSKKILISNSFYEEINKEKNDRRKLSLLSVLIMTILHEVMHCLSNTLPTNSKDYSELSNPFIRTFKKNIKVFDLVVGKSVYKEQKGVADILKENIEDYEYIWDSGHYFENKIFDDYNRAFINYSDSEYFLNLQNLNFSLELFRQNYKSFNEKFCEQKNKLLNLNLNTEICFKRIKNNFIFGRCLLDSRRRFYNK